MTTAAVAPTAIGLLAMPAGAEFDVGDVDEPPPGPTPTYVAKPDLRFVSGDCAGRPAPDGLGINAEVMEHDSGDLTKVRATVADAFDRAGPIGTLLLSQWVGVAAPLVDGAVDEILALFDDDQIGVNTWGYSRTDLAAAVPLVGNTFRETRSFSNGDRAAGAFYQLTLSVTRTA